jgi:GPH family glycoside/pentoside/hexuronide:cation symporter
MWTFVSKLGTALAIFVSGQILELGGYIPQAGNSSVIQPPQVFNAVRLIIGPIPIAVLGAAIVLIQFYPLDKKAFRDLLERY